MKKNFLLILLLIFNLNLIFAPITITPQIFYLNNINSSFTLENNITMDNFIYNNNEIELINIQNETNLTYFNGMNFRFSQPNTNFSFPTDVDLYNLETPLYVPKKSNNWGLSVEEEKELIDYKYLNYIEDKKEKINLLNYNEKVKSNNGVLGEFILFLEIYKENNNMYNLSVYDHNNLLLDKKINQTDTNNFFLFQNLSNNQYKNIYIIYEDIETEIKTKLYSFEYDELKEFEKKIDLKLSKVFLDFINKFI